MRQVNLIVKRMMDIAAGIVGIVVFTLFPVFLIAPIAIRLTSKGPAIFTQKRIGKDAKPFRIYKFRTMINERHDASGKEIMSENRVTKVGKLLRKTSLDEIPQFFNILNGSMSLVGPRPMLDYQAERCEGEELRRFEFRPGVTGLAQVRGRNNIGWEERIKHDVEYVKKFNIGLDIKIIFMTLAMVFKRVGTDVKPEYRGVDRFSRDYKPPHSTEENEQVNTNG